MKNLLTATLLCVQAREKLELLRQQAAAAALEVIAVNYYQVLE